MWTRFMDMHSGGGQKLSHNLIFIEAPEDEAIRIFENRFNRNPNNVTCSCCGSDYSISEEKETLEQSTGYERNCAYGENDEYIEQKSTSRYSYGEYQTIEEFLKREDVLVIRKEDIKPEERAPLTLDF